MKYHQISRNVLKYHEISSNDHQQSYFWWNFIALDHLRSPRNHLAIALNAPSNPLTNALKHGIPTACEVPRTATPLPSAAAGRCSGAPSDRPRWELRILRRQCGPGPWRFHAISGWFCWQRWLFKIVSWDWMEWMRRNRRFLVFWCDSYRWDG